MHNLIPRFSFPRQIRSHTITHKRRWCCVTLDPRWTFVPNMSSVCNHLRITTSSLQSAQTEQLHFPLGSFCVFLCKKPLMSLQLLQQKTRFLKAEHSKTIATAWYLLARQRFFFLRYAHLQYGEEVWFHCVCNELHGQQTNCWDDGNRHSFSLEDCNTAFAQSWTSLSNMKK